LNWTKKTRRSPFIKIEKRTVAMQKEIHFLHLLGNLLFKNLEKKTPRNMIASLLNIKLTKEYLNSQI